MTMFGSQWFAAPDTTYTIDQSIRFNNGDSAYLKRTPASAGNRRTWTWSGWVKRTTLGSRYMFGAVNTGTDSIGFASSGLLTIGFNNATEGVLQTTRLFRDVGAWYHIVVAVDTTESTATNRIRLYVNGVEETDFATDTAPAEDYDTGVNNTVQQTVGSLSAPSGYLDGYLAEVHLIDGSQLTAASFGETNSDTGQWIPKAYSGSYGTNGFYITGADSTALGEDVRISGDQVISYAASQYTGATGSYTYSNGRLEADTDNKAIRTADTFAGDFEFSWRYNTMANFVIGVYETGEDGTFDDSTSTGGMNSMTDSWYLQTSSVAANRDIFYGGAVQVNATTIADGDTWKMTRSSGTIKLIRNGSDVHTFSQTSTNTVRIVVAQGDATADLGQFVWVDNSTLGNNFFSSGLAATDQMSDSPTDNHCTLNPLWVDQHTLSDGNLVASAATDSAAIGTMAFDVTDSDGYYFEAKVTTAATYPNVGIRTVESPSQVGAVTSLSGNSTGRYSFTGSDGNFNDAGSSSSYGSAWAGTADKVIGVLVKAGALYFSIDGTIQNSGTAAKTGLTGYMLPTVFYDAGSGTSAAWEMRFDSSDWGTSPSGYKAISSNNLADPQVENPSAYFHTQLYTGNSTSGHAITNNAQAGDFQPDWLIIAPRSNGDHHQVFDAVRGTTSRIQTNQANAATVDGTALITFETDGFDLDTTDINYNGSGRTYAAWQWKANGSGSSNEDGSITSTVSADTTSGFSIVQYEGTKSNATIGHGLGVAPKWIIIKDFDATESWIVGLDALGFTKNLFLNLNNAVQTSSTIWNDTAPTSSVFSIGTSDGVNKTDTHIAYCFAEVEGFSKFGTYEGNSSADGTFIYTGFRPAWITLKEVDNADDWVIYDTKRDPINVSDTVLRMDSTNSEYSGSGREIDILSNGFIIRTSNATINASNTYAYFAFAEFPLKYANAR